MKVLVACEYSGRVRDAFNAMGHLAVSCDFLPSETPGIHYQGDVFDIIDGWVPVQFTSECDPEGCGECRTTGKVIEDCNCYGPTQGGVEYKEVNGVLLARDKKAPKYDMLIAFPPCTYLSISGMHWTRRGLRDPQLTEDAVGFVKRLMDVDIPRIVIENPVGVLSTRIRKPDQIIQPYDFGEDASKRTCLWLKGVKPLQKTSYVEPRFVNGKKRWSNQTDSGQNVLSPSDTRWKERSKTYQGIADAMATQWG